MSAVQMCLPGCEYIRNDATPLSHNARRVLEVIQGYSRGAWGYCGAFQKTLAATLGRWVRGVWKNHSIRWLSAALAELRRLGLISVRHRGPHCSEYRVDEKRIAELLPSIAPATSLIESVESKTARGKENTPRKPPKRAAIDHNALDRRLEQENNEYLRRYKEAKIPFGQWPIFLKAWAS